MMKFAMSGSTLASRKRARWQMTNKALRDGFGGGLEPEDDYGHLEPLSMGMTDLPVDVEEDNDATWNRTKRRQDTAIILLPKLTSSVEKSSSMVFDSQLFAPPVSVPGPSSKSFEMAEELSHSLRQRQLRGLDELIREEAAPGELPPSTGGQGQVPDEEEELLRRRFNRVEELRNAQTEWMNAKLAAAEAVIRQETAEKDAKHACARVQSMQSTHPFDPRVDERRQWLNLEAKAGAAESDYKILALRMGALQKKLSNEFGLEVGLISEEGTNDVDRCESVWVLGRLKAAGEGLANVLYAIFSTATEPPNDVWGAFAPSLGDITVCERQTTPLHVGDRLSDIEGRVWIVHGSNHPQVDGLYIEDGTFRGAPLFRNPHGLTLFKYALPSLKALGVDEDTTAPSSSEVETRPFSQLLRESLVKVRAGLGRRPAAGTTLADSSAITFGPRGDVRGKRSSSELRVFDCVLKREELLNQLHLATHVCNERYFSRTDTTVNESDVVAVLGLIDQIRLASVEVVESIDAWRLDSESARCAAATNSPFDGACWMTTLTVPGLQLWQASPALQTQSRRHQRGHEPPHYGQTQLYLGMFPSKERAYAAYEEAIIEESMRRGVETKQLGEARVGVRPCGLHNVVESELAPAVAACEQCTLFKRLQTVAPKASFLWKGWNYLLKIGSDLEFLEKLVPLKRYMGEDFVVTGNPFLLSDSRVSPHTERRLWGHPSEHVISYSNGVIECESGAFAVGGQFHDPSDGTRALVLLSYDRVRAADDIVKRETAIADVLRHGKDLLTAGNDDIPELEHESGKNGADMDEYEFQDDEEDSTSPSTEGRNLVSGSEVRRVDADYQDNGASLIVPQVRKPRPGRESGVFCNPRSGEWSGIRPRGYTRRYIEGQDLSERLAGNMRRRAAISRRICAELERCRNRLWLLNVPLLESLLEGGRALGGDRLRLDCRTAQVQLDAWQVMNESVLAVQLAWRSSKARHMLRVLKVQRREAIEMAAVAACVRKATAEVTAQHVISTGIKSAMKVIARPLLTAVERVGSQYLMLSIFTCEHQDYVNRNKKVSSSHSICSACSKGGGLLECSCCIIERPDERYCIRAYDPVLGEVWSLSLSEEELRRRIIGQAFHGHRRGLQSTLCNQAAALLPMVWDDLLLNGVSNHDPALGSHARRSRWEPAKEAIRAEQEAANLESRALMLHALAHEASIRHKETALELSAALQRCESAHMGFEDADARILALWDVAAKVSGETAAALAFSRANIEALEDPEIGVQAGWAQAWDPIEDGNNRGQLVRKRRIEAALSRALSASESHRLARLAADADLAEKRLLAEEALAYAESLRTAAREADDSALQVQRTVGICHSVGYEALRRILTLTRIGCTRVGPLKSKLLFLEHQWETTWAPQRRMEKNCLGAWEVLHRGFFSAKTPALSYCVRSSQRLFMRLLRDPQTGYVLLQAYRNDLRQPWQVVVISPTEVGSLLDDAARTHGRSVLNDRPRKDIGFAARSLAALRHREKVVAVLMSLVRLTTFTGDVTLGKLEFRRRVLGLEYIMQDCSWHCDALTGRSSGRGSVIFREIRRCGGRMLVVSVYENWGNWRMEAYDPAACSAIEVDLSREVIARSLVTNPTALRSYSLGVQVAQYERALAQHVLDLLDFQLPGENGRWWRKQMNGEDAHVSVLPGPDLRYRATLFTESRLISGHHLTVKVLASSRGDLCLTACPATPEDESLLQSCEAVNPKWTVQADSLRRLLVGTVGVAKADRLLVSTARADLAQHLIQHMVLRRTASSEIERSAILQRSCVQAGAMRLALTRLNLWIKTQQQSQWQNFSRELAHIINLPVAFTSLSQVHSHLEFKYTGQPPMDEHGPTLYASSWSADGQKWWYAKVSANASSSVRISLTPESEEQLQSRLEAQERESLAAEDHAAVLCREMEDRRRCAEVSYFQKRAHNCEIAAKSASVARLRAAKFNREERWRLVQAHQRDLDILRAQQLAEDAISKLTVDIEGMTHQNGQAKWARVDGIELSHFPSPSAGEHTLLLKRPQVLNGVIFIAHATLSEGSSPVVIIYLYAPRFCASTHVAFPFVCEAELSRHVTNGVLVPDVLLPSVTSGLEAGDGKSEMIPTIYSENIAVENTRSSQLTRFSAAFIPACSAFPMESSSLDFVCWNESIGEKIGASEKVPMRRLHLSGGALVFALPSEALLPHNARASRIFEMPLRGDVFWIKARAHDELQLLLEEDGQNIAELQYTLGKLSTEIRWHLAALEEGTVHFRKITTERASAMLGAVRRAYFLRDGAVARQPGSLEESVLRLQLEALNATSADLLDPYEVPLQEARLGCVNFEPVPHAEAQRPWHVWRILIQTHIKACPLPVKACPVPCCGVARARLEEIGTTDAALLSETVDTLLHAMWEEYSKRNADESNKSKEVHHEEVEMLSWREAVLDGKRLSAGADLCPTLPPSCSWPPKLDTSQSFVQSKPVEISVLAALIDEQGKDAAGEIAGIVSADVPRLAMAKSESCLHGWILKRLRLRQSTGTTCVDMDLAHCTRGTLLSDQRVILTLYQCPNGIEMEASVHIPLDCLTLKRRLNSSVLSEIRTLLKVQPCTPNAGLARSIASNASRILQISNRGSGKELILFNENDTTPMSDKEGRLEPAANRDQKDLESLLREARRKDAFLLAENRIRRLEPLRLGAIRRREELDKACILHALKEWDRMDAECEAASGVLRTYLTCDNVYLTAASRSFIALDIDGDGCIDFDKWSTRCSAISLFLDWKMEIYVEAKESAVKAARSPAPELPVEPPPHPKAEIMDVLDSIKAPFNLESYVIWWVQSLGSELDDYVKQNFLFDDFVAEYEAAKSYFSLVDQRKRKGVRSKEYSDCWQRESPD